MKCTYMKCEHDAVHQVSEDGAINLCDEHFERMSAAKAALLKGEPDGAKRLVGEWVRAQGGAAAALARTLPGLHEQLG